METRATRTAIVALSVLLIFPGALASVYSVGGSSIGQLEVNWVVPNGTLNYSNWASNFTIHVGDSLYFKYNPNYHNVVKVNSTMYALCDSSHYLQVWDTGDTTVFIQEPGMHYFICGAPTHCQKAQAFSILALPAVGPPPPPPGSNPGFISPPASAATDVHVLRGILTLSLAVLFATCL